MAEVLRSLTEGQLVVLGGDRVVRVSADLAASFREGDQLLVADDDVVHVPAAESAVAAAAVSSAVEAFGALAACADTAIDEFFNRCAALLRDVDVAEALYAANAVDVAAASARGRSTTRLVLDAPMLSDMAAGLEMWRDLPVGRDAIVSTIENDGWSIDVRRSPLGVVGFVFEGRPNVVADAAGVVRTGNTAVLRIGSDALGTATALMDHALRPALAAAGLPAGTVELVASPSHAAGWALFADRRLSLAVARGSGAAVSQLGAIARAAGTPASLHGTGGAWMIVAPDADPVRLEAVVRASLDRKVCNTLNVCCVPRSAASRLLPAVLAGAAAAGEARTTSCIVHANDEAAQAVTASGCPAAVTLAGPPPQGLGHEWEWENQPEFTLRIVDDVDAAVALCNEHSPHFVVSVVTGDAEVLERVYRSVDAPFVGDGFTRWVDGQYALNEPELGLSNWEHGRLLGRGGVLTGASVHTLRLFARVTDPTMHR